jgi:NAD(P)-dependent dehydrogenase (short-subunit alcohol dehydrogenase family)
MTNQQASIDGKICLVTGATSGIGKVTAQVLACEGARVVIGGRNQEKCEAAVQEIKRQSGNQKVEYILADLSCLQDVQHMAQTFLSRHQRLDVLINNAGIALFKKQTSVDGHELTFATNYLGPFLLTNLLLEVLKVSAPARIVTVSSLAHAWAQFNIDNPQKQGGVQGYYSSKFALILFTYELARRLEGTGVTATVLNPGFVATNIGRGNGLLSKIIFPLSNFFNHAVTPEEGAQTILYLATSPEVEGITGKYFSNKKEVPSANATYNSEWGKRLWAMSERLTQVYFPQSYLV